MRLARFAVGGESRFGVVTGDEVVAIDGRVASFSALLADPAAGMPNRSDPRWPTGDVAWLPPFTETAKIICVGFNYQDHAREGIRPATAHPTLFIRWPDSFVGSGSAVIRAHDAQALDWEGEAALAIGRRARRVPADRAAACIAGVTCMAENSERDWQQHSGQATAGKNWTASGACGPWITTADELPPGPLRVSTRLNGQVVQDDTTDHLTYSFPELVSYISTFTVLRPGDVVATGTPAGIGYRQTPPRFLTPGDEISVTVSGVGALTHEVTDETSAYTPTEEIAVP